MALIKSISGIRGTIGGKTGENLTPEDVVKFTAAFASILKLENPDNRKIVIGRDARISGDMINKLATATLVGMGMEVVDLGLSTTPTVEMAVVWENASGGIILTASHNPIQWNALKLLNSKGEFISASTGQKILELAESNALDYAEIKELGTYREDNSYLDKHIDAILNMKLVKVDAIRNANFNVLIDGINSSGAFAVPRLLQALGVQQFKVLNKETNGKFAHNPEPLPENLREITSELAKGDFDLGIVVDPDVDRLAFLCENGEPFGEEYTLVAVADYFLKNSKTVKQLNTVSNLSSTIALKEITQKYGGVYHASAVGEVNVVEKMKAVNALIGGEGNGGIIVPELHYGRDALAGIALFLSHLALFQKPIGMLRKLYPQYVIAKEKIELAKGLDMDLLLSKIEQKYSKFEKDTQDGLKIYFEDGEWVHLRKSNTEPIIRIYAESKFETTAYNLADKIKLDIAEALKD